jgi:hypothetical protein
MLEMITCSVVELASFVSPPGGCAGAGDAPTPTRTTAMAIAGNVLSRTITAPASMLIITHAGKLIL